MLYAGYDDVSDKFLMVQGMIEEARANALQRLKVSMFYLVPDFDCSGIDKQTSKSHCWSYETGVLRIADFLSNINQQYVALYQLVPLHDLHGQSCLDSCQKFEKHSSNLLV